MEIIDAIQTRNSIRAYKTDPVPKSTLVKILEVTLRSPSGQNSQPWEFHIVTGKVLDEIREGNIQMLSSGTPPATEIPRKDYEGEYFQRQIEMVTQMWGLLGFTRENDERRASWIQKTFRLYDAPAAIIIALDKSLMDVQPLSDIGGLCVSICLTALEYGLGTCISDAAIMYPQVIRKVLTIPESRYIARCIDIGYPDPDARINKIRTDREPLDKISTWYGFD